jgi:RNA polymerase sigma-70 factor (ECF subfamily)
MAGELHLSDAQALRRCHRDPDAICALYDRYVARLAAALVHECGDRETAFDIVQETFARTLEHGRRVVLAPDGSAWPWLWTVARNLLHDYRRHKVVDAGARRRLRMATVALDTESLDELIERVDAVELRESLATALAELPREQREAVIARIAGGLEYAKLAEAGGVGEAAIRARVSRGLRSLRLRMSGGKP